MKRRICALVAVVVCSSFAILRNSLVAAQAGTAAGGFTIEQVLDYPFPANLVAAPNGSAIAWTFAERGARNIYVADGSAFTARRWCAPKNPIR